MANRLAVLGLVLLMGSACRPKKSSADAGVTAPPLDRNGVLALAAPHGSAPVDGRLRQLQSRATRKPSPETWTALGAAWVEKARESSDPGYYAHADACAAKALQLQPAYPTARQLRAVVLYNDHKFAQARDMARSLVASDPNDETLENLLADASLELGDYEAAEEAARRSLALNKGLGSHGRLAHLLWLRGDEAGADEESKQAGLSPDDAEPRAWLAIEIAKRLFQRGDYERADVEVDRALALVQDYKSALVERGRIALASGDAERAVTTLRTVVDRYGGVEAAWLLGDAYEAMANRREADRAYALAATEGAKGDARTLSLFYSTKNRSPNEALALARQDLAERQPIYSRDAEAWALFRLGRFAEAQTAIDSACRLGTKDARLLYHRGAITLANGRQAEGRALVARALALNPKFDPTAAPEAQALLADRR